MPRKKASAKKTKRPSRRQPKRFSWRAIRLMLLGACIPLIVYIVYLDRIVVKQFEGKRFSLPARVYARPLELYPEKPLSATQLNFELKKLNYTNVSNVVHSGQFNASGNTFSIYIRPFTFWDDDQNELHIQVKLSRGRVSHIRHAVTGERLNLVRLDPIQIGGIYPNQGEDRILVRLSQVPDHLINALIATEDKRFYQHHGVDPKAVLRAFSTLFTGQRVQGGSTITQQLVKNFFLTQERTIRRKIKEMIMAVLLELHYDKKDILETYLNEVYFGQDRNRAIHGFGLASEFYFSRNVEHIQVEQAALLVGLLKGPTYYNPRKHTERAKKRRNVVLTAMFDQNFINKGDYNTAKNKPVVVSKLPDKGQSPYPAFLDLVVRQLKRDYREEDLRSEGLRIFTSLNPYFQEVSENAMSKRLAALENSRGLPKQHLQGSAVLVDVNTGEIQSLIGDRNTKFQGFNRALDASRQIGSLIKPAIYVTALTQKDHYHLATPLDDSPFAWEEPGIETWQPQNYDRKFHGEPPLWLALAKSYNVAAARLGTELGVNNVMNTVRRLGIEKQLPDYASGLLGTVHLSPYEVAQMYHTIANGGFKMPFRAIRNVTTMGGSPLNRYKLSVEPAMDAETNYLIVRGLQEVVSRGTAADLPKKLTTQLRPAGKTGTTDDLRDSWFAGFTGDKVGVVWIGNDKNHSIHLTGASGALKVWGDIFEKLPSQPVDIITPEDIEYLGVNKASGLLESKHCQNIIALPFHADSVQDSSYYCGRKSKNRVKNWFKGLFN